MVIVTNTPLNTQRNPKKEKCIDERQYQTTTGLCPKMTYIVGEACILCKHTDCVDVCPVDCFVEGPNFLAINPDECIDCAVCVPECPENAIYAEDDVPEDQKRFIALNAELSKLWPPITKSKDSLPDADKWSGIVDKLQYLNRG